METLFLILGLIAFFVALSTRKRNAALEERLKVIERTQQRLDREVALLRRSAEPQAPDSVPPKKGALDAPPSAAADQPAPTPIEPTAEEPQPVPDAPTVPPISAPPATAGPHALPSSRGGLEEELGTRWVVWVGGLALALGGVLLVRYSIEQDFFGPTVRVLLGVLLAAALISSGEWFRRSDIKLAIEAVQSAHIPSVLTAAGTITAFATIYAAHALYDFIGPGVAFVLLGLAGVATMLASALHGPALAGLGLVGAFVTPVLVSSPSPNPWPVVLYLAVVASAAYGLARLRHWLWLAVAAVAGVGAWGLVLLDPPVSQDLTWTWAAMVHTALQTMLASFFMAVQPHLGRRDEGAWPDAIATAALAALTALALVVLAHSRFRFDGWVPFALVLVAILLVAGWLSAPSGAAMGLAGLVALGAMLLWPGLRVPPAPTLLALEIAPALRVPENVRSFLTFSAMTPLAIAALASVRLYRGAALPAATAALYAAAATAPLLLALVIAYLRVTQFDRSIPFALCGAALACLFAVAADRFQRAEGESAPAALRVATGAFAAAGIAALSFALVAGLDRGYMTVAFALAALGTAFVAMLKDIPLLRYAVTTLGLVVLGRVAWDPRIMGADVGRWPILNWLLFGYGVPAAAFAISGSILRRRGEDLAVRLVDALAVLFAALLAFFQIRHLLNAGDPLAKSSSHVEQGLFAMTSLAFAFVLTRLDLARANPVFYVASLAFGVISALFVVLGLGLAQNPLFTGEQIYGAPVFSSLMLAYLLPGLMAVVIARASQGVRPDWYVTGAGVLALALLFGYVTLEVRHIYQGDSIRLLQHAGEAEKWTYSVAWLLLGLVFLAYGVWRASREARLASAALVLLSVLKVFLLDLEGLTGLWRALSFISLGLVLIGIGLVYQKLIFAKPRMPSPPST